MNGINIGDINLETKKPKIKEKNEEGGWVEKNDGSGKYKWVKGPGKWIEKNDGSGFYTWKSVRRY